jgi:hypothetical protein
LRFLETRPYEDNDFVKFEEQRLSRRLKTLEESHRDFPCWVCERPGPPNTNFNTAALRRLSSSLFGQGASRASGAEFPGAAAGSSPGRAEEALKQRPVGLHHGEDEGRADAKQDHAISRFVSGANSGAAGLAR